MIAARRGFPDFSLPSTQTSPLGECHEHSVQTLSSNEFGHKIQRLVKEAERLFLKIEDEDREVFSLVADTDTVIEARYIRTGSKSLPALEGLKRTSENVRNHVGARLRELGVMVRL
jgi:hypothetical protein